MSKPFSDRINALFQRSEWKKARQLLEKEQEKDPSAHWVLTQLGVTFYEERRYKKALQFFEASKQIVPDCPLTIWNFAGTLDSLGRHTEALRHFASLLQSQKTAKEDPCWESRAWTEALKTDCLYRMGICFENLGEKKQAEQCFRNYLDLLLSGGTGNYSLEEVTKRIRKFHGTPKNGEGNKNLKKAIAAILQAASLHSSKSKPASISP